MAEKLVKVRINRDFGAKADNGDVVRHRKGTEIDVPVEAALDGIESGALSRVKEDAKK